MADSSGYLDRARSYWRYSPGGTGKVDSVSLAEKPDAEFLSIWRHEKRVRRITVWEEEYFLRFFSEQARGRDVLSFGCGLGYSELDLLDAGARVTFADIVPSCVACAERICRLTGHSGDSRFLAMDDSADTDFGGPYDIVFAYGSLMHMPEARQQRVLQQMCRALRPGGRIWLMLYTPEFVKSTGSTFDQTAFARHSDPSVDGLDNPWSDWHDDEKLQRIAGPELRITRRETFNENRYVWYQLERTADSAAGDILPLIDLAGREAAQIDDELARGQAVIDFDLASAKADDASVSAGGNGEILVETGENQFHYALVFPKTTTPSAQPNRLIFDAQLDAGGFAIGLLDVAADRFFYNTTFARVGRVRSSRDLSALEWPPVFQVVISNFRPTAPARSTFRLRRLTLLRHEV